MNIINKYVAPEALPIKVTAYIHYKKAPQEIVGRPKYQFLLFQLLPKY